MTKNDKRDVRLACEAIVHGDVGFAARSISAAIRAAMTKKSRAELWAWADKLQITQHPDFII